MTKTAYYYQTAPLVWGEVGWCKGSGKLRPTIWMVVGQGPIALAVGAGGSCLDIFTLRYLFSSFSLSLGDAPK